MLDEKGVSESESEDDLSDIYRNYEEECNNGEQFEKVFFLLDCLCLFEDTVKSCISRKTMI